MSTLVKAYGGELLLAACCLVPLLGCVLVVWTGQWGYFVLLLPLMIFMEGGFILIGVAVAVTLALMDGG